MVAEPDPTIVPHRHLVTSGSSRYSIVPLMSDKPPLHPNNDWSLTKNTSAVNMPPIQPLRRRKDPACGTCRKNCRGCDRKRPVCSRCTSKGVHCEGYPPKFEFRGVDPSKWRTGISNKPQQRGNADEGLPRPAIAESNQHSGSMDFSNPSQLTPRSLLQQTDERPSGTAAAETAQRRGSVEFSFATQPATSNLLQQRDQAPAGAVATPATAYLQDMNEYEDTVIINDGPDIHNVPNEDGRFRASAHISQNYDLQHSPATPASGSSLNPTGTYARLDEVDLLSCRPLIEHFRTSLASSITFVIPGLINPLNEHILPLAYRHDGVLHALLGLAACHMYTSGIDESQECVNAALQHRVGAIRSLGLLLEKEGESQLSFDDETNVLAIVLLLVFHDMCETGVSSCGSHLTGVAFLCSRLADQFNPNPRSKATVFFVSALTWLDTLRAFSGAEKLTYSEEVHEFVRDHGSRVFHSFVGCPPVLFSRIGQVLRAGKAHLAGVLPPGDFAKVLRNAEQFFRGWDPDQATYPTADGEWRQLADAFRWTYLLRVLRFPDPSSVPCTDTNIRASVSDILDICATMSRESVFYKRLLLPLFMAAADTCSPHQIHYAYWCIDEIRQSTGFPYSAMMGVLDQVWEQRQSGTCKTANCPWMEFTCSEELTSQHAYLFF